MRQSRQTILPFLIQEDRDTSMLTSFCGLPLLHELLESLGVKHLAETHLHCKDYGYSESEMMETILSLIVAGGDHMDDICLLEKDKGLKRILGKNEIPTSRTIGRFLKKFHKDQNKPSYCDAWVPHESKALFGLRRVSTELAKNLIKRSGLTEVTIENDATAVFSQKDAALGTYKGGTGYMPVIGTVAELGLVIADEFRDGNVPPSFEVLNFFRRCQSALPSTVKKVKTRLDGAYYQHDLMAHFDFWNIDYTITAMKSEGIMRFVEALQDKDWKTLRSKDGIDTGKDYAEMPWVSANGTREKMRERMHRYLITRKRYWQPDLLKEQTSEEKNSRYEVIVSNMQQDADELIVWHYQRGGNIEHVHDRIKNDLAGSVMPCGEFGANAAWWRINCMAWNLVRALQIHALPNEYKNCHMKKLRLWLINIAGRVIATGRRVILKLSQGHPAFKILTEARIKIAGLSTA
jgi:hypothetical protein